MNRRELLRSSGIVLAGFGLVPAIARAALSSPASSRRKTLVIVFQRGAADPLSILPPHGEPLYYSSRPAIAIPAPGKGDGAALSLDSTFGLHPALSALKPLWDRKALGAVISTGSADPTRSHFDAQDYMETGTPGRKSTEDGWLNRTLRALPREGRSPWRAVSLSDSTPRSLTGREPSVSLPRISTFRLSGAPGTDGTFESMYLSAAGTALGPAASETVDALALLRKENVLAIGPENGAAYPSSELGQRMRQIAQLVKSGIGVTVAATDCGGWDTHLGQGSSRGQLANRLEDLGNSLAAFATDLGERLADVATVVMTEFGRTVRENGTRGTDHGHGSVMLVLGGPVKGREVRGTFRGLHPANLYEGRDLPVTTDFRQVLSEILEAHLGIRDTTEVFPGYIRSRTSRTGIV